MVGLGNVDNTSDANKPVSSATLTALNAKAALTANQTFTGTQTLYNAATGVTPVIVNGITGTTVNLQEWQVNGTARVSIGVAGNPTFKLVNYAGNQSNGITVSSYDNQWLSGLWLQSNSSGFPRLSFMSPSGTTGNIGTETVSIDNNSRMGINSISPAAALDVRPVNQNAIGQIIRGAGSQQQDLLQIQSSTPTVLAGINNIGQVFTGSTAPLQNYPALVNAQMSVLSNSTTTPTMILRPYASQTANILEVQDSAGTTLKAKIASDGAIYTLGTLNVNAGATGYLNLGDAQISKGPGAGFAFTSGITNISYLGIGGSGSGTNPLNVVLGNASAFPIIQGAANHTADLLKYLRSDGTVLGGTNANGQIYSGLTTIKGSTVALTAASASSTTVATYTYGGTTSLVTIGQLVTITNVTPSYFNSPANGFAVTAIGGSSGAWTFTVAGSGFTTSGTGTAFGTFQLPAQASITSSSAGTVGLVVKATGTQTANLLSDWQKTDGTSLVSIDGYGTLTAAGGQIGLAAYAGGALQLSTAGTTTWPAIGSGKGRLYFKTGTTGLKLVAQGPTGTEVTIADNIT
jgi:hypothetical protein